MTTTDLSPEDAWSWQEREPIDGVAFRRGDPVVVVAGDRLGQRGRTDGLLSVTPEPHFVVFLEPDETSVTLPQSALRSAHAEHPTGVLAELSQWYASETDGDWEHSHGIDIGTLDNPGWTVRIALTDTILAGRPFTPVGDPEPQTDWMFCRVEGEMWCASCGPFMLERAIRIFLIWAKADDSS